MPEFTRCIDQLLPPVDAKAPSKDVSYFIPVSIDASNDGDKGLLKNHSEFVFQAVLQGEGCCIQKAANNLLEMGEGSAGVCYGALSPYRYGGSYHLWIQAGPVENFLSNISQFTGKYLSEFMDGWIADTAGVRAKFLRMFLLPPNPKVNGCHGGLLDCIANYMQPCADIIHCTVVSFLGLFFGLRICKSRLGEPFWGSTKYAKKLGRWVVTAGVVIAWPAIHDFGTTISNEIIKFIWFGSIDQVLMLDYALAQAVKGGVIASGAAASSFFAPLLANFSIPVLGKFVGEFFYFVSVISFTILSLTLLVQLVYVLFVKAVHLALQAVLFITAPVFLLLFATPETESYGTGFVKSCAEVSLWTFAWAAALKIMAFIMYSNCNPWGKVLISMALLQLMIQVPGLIGKARISPVSAFVSEAITFSTFSRAVDRIMHMWGTLVSLGMGWWMNESSLIGRPRTDWVEGEDLN